MAKRGVKTRTARNSRQPAAVATGADWEPPGYLSELARAEYARLVGLMRGLGVLDRTDPRLVELWAINYDLARLAYAEIVKDGSTTVMNDRGNTSEHPAIVTINSATIRLKAIANDLGLTPASSKHTRSTQGEEKASRWAGLLKISGA